MIKIVKNNSDSTVNMPDIGISIPSGQSLTIPSTDYALWAKSDSCLPYIISGDIIINDGVRDLGIGDGIDLIRGSYSQFKMDRDLLDTSGRMKMSLTYDPHGTTHQSGGSDEINVQGLQGVLANQQHIIPQEARDAMGVKGNTNPYHHDRFQQSEISNLPETQLALNNPTHSNANDPNTNQKQALDSAQSPSGSNPFTTVSRGYELYSSISHNHDNLPTSNQKAALDAAQGPTSSNRFITLSELSDTILPIVANHNTLFARVGDELGQIVKVLDDTTISSYLYEAGWYEKVSSGNGTNGSNWLFHPTHEAHVHPWSQIQKEGSKLEDIADVPAYPSPETTDKYLVLNNGLMSWQPKPKKFFHVNCHDMNNNALSTGSFFELEGSTWKIGSYSGWSASSTSSLKLPFTAKLVSVSLSFKGIAYNLLNQLGNVYIGLSFPVLNYNGAATSGKIKCVLPDQYVGGSIDNISFTVEIPRENILPQGSYNGILPKGTPLGILFESIDSLEGSIYTLRYPVLLLEFEEV